jgi:N6-adenosine-specific RNA methylase IME4
MIDWPFAPLRPLAYDFIMADPPWDYETWSEKGATRGGKAHYATMPLPDIQALPVSHLARGDCCLFLWACWPMLPQAIETLGAWGFKYATGGVWHKKTVHGKTAFGTGYRVRCSSEPWLLGFVGNPPNSRSHRNVIEGATREHSRKPEEAYRWAEAYMPGAWRVELFSRQARPNWDSWGNETGKFAAEAA